MRTTGSPTSGGSSHATPACARGGRSAESRHRWRTRCRASSIRGASKRRCCGCPATPGMATPAPCRSSRAPGCSAGSRIRRWTRAQPPPWRTRATPARSDRLKSALDRPDSVDVVAPALAAAKVDLCALVRTRLEGGKPEAILAATHILRAAHAELPAESPCVVALQGLVKNEFLAHPLRADALETLAQVNPAGAHRPAHERARRQRRPPARRRRQRPSRAPVAGGRRCTGWSRW